MDFTRKKLPGKRAIGMSQIRVADIKPYSLIWAPAYLFFKANDKLVSVKSPLDFFNDAELNSIKPFEVLYFSTYLNEILSTQKKGKNLREAIQGESDLAKKLESDPFSDVSLPPTSFELSDFALRSVAPLWWKTEDDKMTIEPMLVAIFVNEVCDLLSSEKLEKAREVSVVRFADSILKSSWVVFLALHLGYCDLRFLNKLRNRIFDESMSQIILDECTNEIDELIKYASMTVGIDSLKLFKDDLISNREEKVALKLGQRLERVNNEFMKPNQEPPSIFGVKGFMDV